MRELLLQLISDGLSDTVARQGDGADKKPSAIHEQKVGRSRADIYQQRRAGRIGIVILEGTVEGDRRR